MQNKEFDEILASMEQIVRQAYAMGRSDALKQVVEVLKNDAPAAKPLALMAPAEDPAEPSGSRVMEEDRAAAPSHPAGGGKPPADTASAPWWTRQPRWMW